MRFQSLRVFLIRRPGDMSLFLRVVLPFLILRENKGKKLLEDDRIGLCQKCIRLKEKQERKRRW